MSKRSIQDKDVEKVLIYHPVETIGSVIYYTGAVRYIRETVDDNIEVVMIVSKDSHQLFVKHYADLPNFKFEVLNEVNDSNMLKLFLMGPFRTVKDRRFFGAFDKLRLDEYKKAFDETTPARDMYSLYGIDPSVRYSHFRIVIDEDINNKLYRKIKTIANMNYNLTSKSDLIPKHYKKNAMLSLNIDGMFNTTNFFDSFALIKRTSQIYITTDKEDYFTTMLYYMDKSGAYADHFQKKKILLFQKNRSNPFDPVPESWTVVDA